MRNLGVWSAFSLLLALVAACGGSSGTGGSTPVANAGPPQSVATGSVVTLDGSQSFDPDGRPITYEWSFVSVPPGSHAALSDPTTPKPTFTADVDGTYSVELVVSTGKATSQPNDVLVNATTANTPPTAKSGPDQNVAVGSVVDLDGSGSSDPDGDPLTYSWSFVSIPPGSQAGIQDPTSAKTLFVADVAGEYHVQLVVSDGIANSAASRMIVTASVQNSPPVANAGPDQSVTTGAVVNIDGTASTHADGDPLTYQWTLVSKPDGSSAGIQDPTAAQTLFLADVDGQYVLQLVVSDGQASSAPDMMVVTATSATVPSMTGEWKGSATFDGVQGSVDLILAEAQDGTISGLGTLTAGGQSGTGEVTGTHVHPNVTIQVASTPPITFSGTFTDPDTVKGTVTVDTVSIPLTIKRQ